MKVQNGGRRTARNARAILEHVESTQQMKMKEEFCGATLFGPDGSVLINVANGVIRVTKNTIELLPHCKGYNFLGCLAASYDKDAQPHLFCKHLPQWLPDCEDRHLLQWFLGYIFYPNATKHEVFLLCYGPAGSGKSTMADAIQAVLGEEGLVQSLSMNQLCSTGQGAYSLSSLRYALVNLGTELDTVEVDDGSNFKKLVSGEAIQVREIYGAPFRMKSTCKHMFLANAIPCFKHGTDAEWRRSRFLAFDLKIEPGEKDITLKERLAAEGNGILNFMLPGVQMILRGEECPEGSESSKKIKAKFAVTNDPVSYFVNNFCVLDPNVITPKERFHTEFSDFLESQGFPPRTKEHLLHAVYKRFPKIIPLRVKENDRYNQGKMTGRREAAGTYVAGVRLKDDSET
jgi:P4 family phage/plasmid primase-like protien